MNWDNIYWLYAITGTGLLGSSIQDIRRKKLSVKWMWVWSGISVFALAVVLKISNIEGIYPALLPHLLGMVPGFLLLGISFLTKEKIGYGDGWVVLILGLSIGYESTIQTLLLAFLLAFLWALYLMFGKKTGKNAAFAFVPFLLIGFVGGFFV